MIKRIMERMGNVTNSYMFRPTPSERKHENKMDGIDEEQTTILADTIARRRYLSR